MARRLNVFLHQALAGELIQDDYGQLQFSYAESWLGKPEAVALSQSLPLRVEAFSRNECRAFFSGILPEEGKREIIARNLGISARNDFAMLEQIGGECAGAVSFRPDGEEVPPAKYHYRELSDAQLAGILRLLPRRPLMAGEDGIRLSLAGAQDKIAVHVIEGRVSLPLGAAPSTHILKPASERLEGLVQNEAFCMQLLTTAGLAAADISTGRVEDIDYLLVERYDRTRDENGNALRLHQEDFCQALGIIPEHRYESEGGPSIVRCMELLRAASSLPVIDLMRLLDAVIANLLIGNNDAHGKNFSLLHTGKGIRLAPLYDVLSSIHYPELSTRMAMKIGGESKAERVMPQHFARLAADAGLSGTLVLDRVMQLAGNLIDSLDRVRVNGPVAEKISEVISARCSSVMERFG